MSHPQWEDLLVVGTTTPVRHDDLPARLAPVFRGSTGRYYLPIEGDTPEDISFEEADEPWVNVQREDRDILFFDVSFPAQPGHVLLQTHASAPPEYFAETGLRARLADLGREALRAAARSLAAGERRAAEEHVWYAARAVPREPLPLLVLRALLRGEIPPDHLAVLEKDIAALSEQERRQALNVEDDELKPLVDLVRADMPARFEPSPVRTKPRSNRPAYLMPMDDVPNFLALIRRCLAPSTELQPA